MPATAPSPTPDAKPRSPEPHRKRTCGHCGTSESITFRRAGPDNLLVCNACGLYWRKYGRMRPQEVCDDYTFKTRERPTAAAGGVKKRGRSSSLSSTGSASKAGATTRRASTSSPTRPSASRTRRQKYHEALDCVAPEAGVERDDDGDVVTSAVAIASLAEADNAFAHLAVPSTVTLATATALTPLQDTMEKEYTDLLAAWGDSGSPPACGGVDADSPQGFGRGAQSPAPFLASPNTCAPAQSPATSASWISLASVYNTTLVDGEMCDLLQLYLESLPTDGDAMLLTDDAEPGGAPSGWDDLPLPERTDASNVSQAQLADLKLAIRSIRLTGSSGLYCAMHDLSLADAEARLAALQQALLFGDGTSCQHLVDHLDQ